MQPNGHFCHPNLFLQAHPKAFQDVRPRSIFDSRVYTVTQIWHPGYQHYLFTESVVKHLDAGIRHQRHIDLLSISECKSYKVARIYIKDPSVSGYMARYNTFKKSTRKRAYRKPVSRPHKRPRKSGGSFASQVKKANLSSAQSKNVSA